MAVYFKHFTNFLETIRGGVFLIAKILKKHTTTGFFLGVFSNFKNSYSKIFERLHL